MGASVGVRIPEWPSLASLDKIQGISSALGSCPAVVDIPSQPEAIEPLPEFHKGLCLGKGYIFTIASEAITISRPLQW